MGFREFSGVLDGETGYVLFDGKLDEEEEVKPKTPPQYLPENQPDYFPTIDRDVMSRVETRDMDPRDLRQRPEYQETVSAAVQKRLGEAPQNPMRTGSTGAYLREYDKALMGDSSREYMEGLKRNAETQDMDPRDLRLEREALVRPKYTETVRYVDPVGNPVSVDVERTGAPKIQTNVADRPEPTAEWIATDLANRITDLPAIAGDFIDAAYAKAIGDEQRLKAVQDRYSARERTRERDTPKFSNEWLDDVYSGVQSTIQQAPGMAASILTGGVAPGLAYAALSQGMPVFNESLAKGASGSDAMVNAIGQGAMEALFELPSMKFIVDKFGKAAVRQFVGGLVAREVPLEIATTHSQNAWDIASRHSLNPTSDEAKKEWQNWLETLGENTTKTVISTVTQVALMGGASGATSAIRNATATPPQEVAKTEAIDKARNLFNPEGMGQQTAPMLKGVSDLTQEPPALYRAIAGTDTGVQYQARTIMQEAEREIATRTAETAAIIDPNRSVDEAISIAEQAVTRPHNEAIGAAEANKIASLMPMPQPVQPALDESVFSPQTTVPETTVLEPAVTETTPQGLYPQEPAAQEVEQAPVRNFRYVALAKRTDAELRRSLDEVKSEVAKKGIEEEVARRGLDFSQKPTGIEQPSPTPTVEWSQEGFRQSRIAASQPENVGLAPLSGQPPVVAKKVRTKTVVAQKPAVVDTQAEERLKRIADYERRALHYERRAAKAELAGDIEKSTEYAAEAESLRSKARSVQANAKFVEPEVTVGADDVDAEISREVDAGIVKAKEVLKTAFGDAADTVDFGRLEAESPSEALQHIGGQDQGYYKDGKRVILVDNVRAIRMRVGQNKWKTIVSAEDNIPLVAIHETFHYGHDAYFRRPGFGKKSEVRDPFGYTSSLRLAESNPHVAKIAKQIKEWNDGVARKANPTVFNDLAAAERQLLAAKTPEQRATIEEKVVALRKLSGVMPKGIAVEEAMAKIGEAVVSGNYKELELRFNTKFDKPAKSSLVRVWRNFVAGVRKLVRAAGIKLSASDNDVVAILDSWKKAVREDLADPKGVWTGKYQGEKLSSRADRATDVLWDEGATVERANRKVDELILDTRPHRRTMSVEDFDRMAEPTLKDERLPMDVDRAIANAREIEDIEAAPPPDERGEKEPKKNWVPSEGLEERYAIGYAHPGTAKLRIREGEITKLTFVTAADARKMGAVEDQYGYLVLPEDGKKADLAKVLPKEFNKELVDFWKKMRKVPGAFRYELAKPEKEFFSDLVAKDDYSVVNKLADEMGITRQYSVDVTYENPAKLNKFKSKPTYTRLISIKLTDKKDDKKKATGTLKYYRQDAHGYVRLNGMSWGKDLGGVPFFVANTNAFDHKSGIGTVWYSLVSEFVDRVRVPVVGDYMLSNINLYRRTEHMLSSAVRHGTTRNFIPAGKQDIYGWVARPLTPKQEAENMARLIVASARNTQQAMAGLENLSYDPETDKFTHEDGSDAEQFVADKLKLRYSRMASIGRATVARAVLSQMVLDGRIEPSQVKRFVKPILYSQAEEVKDSPIWRSELRDQVEAINAKAMTPGDWITRIKSLKGVKKDEIFWSGVEEWLKLQEGKVAKEAVLGYLDENGVRVEESVLSSQVSHKTELEELAASDKLAEADVGGQLTDEQKSVVKKYAGPIAKNRYSVGHLMDAAVEIGDEADELELELSGGERVGLATILTAKKFASAEERARKKVEAKVKELRSVVDGLWNVVEKNLPEEIVNAFDVIAERKGWRKPEVWNHYGYSNLYEFVRLSQDFGPQGGSPKYASYQLSGSSESYHELLLTLPREVQFKSTHFDQPNILAHIRFSVRTDEDGKRVMFIEEIQSDWAKEGRTFGFGRTPQELASLERKVRELGITDPMPFVTGKELEEAGASQELLNELAAVFQDQRHLVTPAPFVTKTEAWTALVMKRAIKWAADNGLDRIAWTTGTQQNERYNLSKKVKKITWGPLKPGEWTRVNIDPISDVGPQRIAINFDESWVARGGDNMGELSGKKIEDILGKDIAGKITSSRKGSLAGEGLSVGGSGMRVFYDVIVPNVVNDILRKIGGGKVSSLSFEGMGKSSFGPQAGARFVVMEMRRGVERVYTTNDNREDAEKNAEAVNKGGGKAWVVDSGKKTSTQQGFDITSAMKAEAEKGMTLFSRAYLDSPEFKEFIGDSKVKHLVYHNTNAGTGEWGGIPTEALDFKVFDTQRSELGTHFGNKAQANEFGSGRFRRIIPAYIRIENPLRLIDYGGFSWDHVADQLVQKGLMTEEESFNGPSDEDFKGALKKLSKFSGKAVKRLQDAIKAGGYDGVVYLNRREGFNAASKGFFGADLDSLNDLSDYEFLEQFPDAEDSWIVFDPEQVKSPFNQGTFDRGNPDFLRSRPMANVGNPINSWAIPDETKFRHVQRLLQDSLARLSVVQNAISAQGGTVTEGTNVYRAEERSHGRIQTSIERLKTQFMRPLAKKLADTGLSFDELAVFAYAKFAEQRNDRIRRVRPGMDDGSGMTDDDAKQIIATAKHAGLYDALEDAHKDLMALTAATRRIQLEEGLISQATYDAWEEMYPDYIPLRGFENVDEDGAPIRGGGRGINVRGEESLRALGRRSRAANLIENAIMDYERTIIRAERNNVAKHLFALAQANPDAKLWEIDPERTSVTFDKDRDLVIEKRVPDRGERTVSMKLNGDVVYMRINDDLLLRALRKTFVDETGSAQYKLAEHVGWYNDWIRNTLTRYNPAFMASNAVLDAQMGALSVIDELGSGALPKYTKHYFAATKTAWNAARGTLDKTGNNYYHRMYEEFQNAGATTGGFFMRDAKEVTDELRAMLLDEGGTLNTPKTGLAGAVEKTYLAARGTKAGKLAAKTVEWIEHAGEASENMSRFAAYVTAREMGKSPAEAASIAKNLTTNFNRKGEYGTGLNALYLFYNASMQGGARVMQAMQNREVQAIVAGMAASAIGLALLNATLGGEDDEGNNYWDLIPAHEKGQNLIIMLPPGEKLDPGMERVGKIGRYLKVPSPYGYRVFIALGHALVDAGRFALDPKRGRTYIKSASDLVGAIFGSFNPISGAFDPSDWKAWMMAASPTIFDLPIKINEEINDFGRKTAPSNTGYYPIPDSERVFLSDAGTIQHRMARWLNEAGGGNRRQSSNKPFIGKALDITPATITTVTRAATGGIGQIVLDIANTLAQTADPKEDLSPRNIPVIKRLYGNIDERNIAGSYYENVDTIAEKHKQLLAAMKLGIKVEMDPENKALLKIGAHMDAVNKAMSAFRERELQIIEDPKMSDDEKKLKRQKLQANRERLMNRFNQAYREIWARHR